MQETGELHIEQGGKVVSKPIPQERKPDVVTSDMSVKGMGVKSEHPSLLRLSPFVTRNLSYLVGRSEDGFVLLRCTPEGYLIVNNRGTQQVRFGDSTGVDDVVKCAMWKIHTFADVYNYLHVYVFGVYLEVETSMDGKIWGNRRITIGDGSASPHVSTLELYADFRYVRIRIAKDGKLASYSINVSKVE